MSEHQPPILRRLAVVQAINLAMSMVGADLYGSPYHEAGTLMFEGPGTGYGFPVAPDYRENLIGDDRLSF